MTFVVLCLLYLPTHEAWSSGTFKALAGGALATVSVFCCHPVEHVLAQPNFPKQLSALFGGGDTRLLQPAFEDMRYLGMSSVDVGHVRDTDKCKPIKTTACEGSVCDFVYFPCSEENGCLAIGNGNF